MKRSGVYTIENIVDGKMYVGYTTNFYARKSKHWGRLKSNRHTNQHLQNAINLYGIENFKFEILIECEEEYLASEENYWCNILNVHNRKYGYNILPTGPNGRTIVSEETKKKISNSTKRNKKRKIYKN